MTQHHLSNLSRRAFLRRTTTAGLGVGLAAAREVHAAAYVGAVRGTDPSTSRTPRSDGGQPAAPVSAVEFMLDAFERYPVVALGEAHSMQEEHDVITSLLQHPAFPTMINDIVVEFGNALYQEVVDRYVLTGEDVAPAELRLTWRNTTQSPTQTWDAPMYPQFFATVRAVNQTLPAARRVRVWLGDPPVDWRLVRNRDDLAPFLFERDVHFASVVEREVFGRGRRALLIAGTFHLFRPVGGGDGGGTVTAHIEQRHPGSTLVVTPHIGFGQRTCDLEPGLAGWPAPSVARVGGTWLGALPATLAFGGQGSFIGLDGRAVDPFEGLTIEDLVDAYLYAGPLEALSVAVPPLSIYRDDGYFQELNRRHLLVFGEPINEEESHYFRYGIPRREVRPRRQVLPPGATPE